MPGSIGGHQDQYVFHVMGSRGSSDVDIQEKLIYCEVNALLLQIGVSMEGCHNDTTRAAVKEKAVRYYANSLSTNVDCLYERAINRSLPIHDAMYVCVTG
jgi:hypothetical protein